MVDLVDIGLMNTSDAIGRRRLNDTMRQLSDAVSAGIVVDVETTSGSGPGRVAVTSLRRCDADVAGCGNASVVAEANNTPPRRGAIGHRPRAVTSSNDTMTSSTTCQTISGLGFIACCLLSLCLNRLRHAATTGRYCGVDS